MKKLVTLGLLLATVAFAGQALAGEGGGTLMDQELQKLFEWSAQAGETTKPGASYQVYPGYQGPEQAVKPAGRTLAGPVAPYQQYPGFEAN